jgi:hypothetical protein
MFLSVSSATSVLLDRRYLVGALKRQANFTRAVLLSCPSLCEATNVNRINNWLWCHRRLLKKVQFQAAGRGTKRATRSSRCKAFWGHNKNNTPPPGGQERPSYSNEDDHSRKATLLRFVKSVRITAEGPSEEGYEVPAPVLAAMRQTVTNLLGTLPPQYFKVTISTRGDNLAQLMFSVLMTGYMFCNAWYRMQLSENMIDQSKPAALVSSASGSIDELIEEEDFDFQGRAGLAAGSQKLRIEGQVLRWHHEDGVQEIPALEYIEQLEAELAGLKAKLHGQKRKLKRESEPRSFGNELLDYMKGLTSDQVTGLTECASADVLEAMNALIDRLLGGEDDSHGYHGEWAPGKSECTATELGHALYWLLVIGHELRNLEVRTSLTASLKAVDDFGGEWGGPQDGAGGPPSADWVPRLPPGK